MATPRGNGPVSSICMLMNLMVRLEWKVVPLLLYAHTLRRSIFAVMTFNKKGGRYASPEMKAFITQVADIEAGEEAAEAAFESTAQVNETTPCSGSIAPATQVHHLEFDGTLPTSQYKLMVPSDGNYVIYLQHAPSEFGPGDFLLDDHGEHVEPSLTEPAAKSNLLVATPEAWGLTMVSVLLQCLTPIVPLVCLYHLLKNSTDENVESQKVLLNRLNAFGSGCLFGAIFLHIYPESLALSGPTNVITSNWLFVCGFVICLAGSALLGGGGADHQQQQIQPQDVEMASTAVDGDTDPKNDGAVPTVETGSGGPQVTKVDGLACSIVFADGLHNAVDGVMTAVAFMACPSTGWIITLAIICHELPQELAEFSLLVQNGWSPAKAAGLNVLSATVAFAGAISMMAVAGSLDASTLGLILAVSAGGLLYATCVVTARLYDRGGADGCKQSGVGLIALFLLGVGMIALVMQLHPHCDVGGEPHVEEAAGGDEHEGHGHLLLRALSQHFK